MKYKILHVLLMALLVMIILALLALFLLSWFPVEDDLFSRSHLSNTMKIMWLDLAMPLAVIMAATAAIIPAAISAIKIILLETRKTRKIKKIKKIKEENRKSLIHKTETAGRYPMFLMIDIIILWHNDALLLKRGEAQ